LSLTVISNNDARIFCAYRDRKSIPETAFETKSGTAKVIDFMTRRDGT
jgi:hypothetical protein